tara:strand:+ start:1523 stop:1873 length:351 start_codon:yes stop_codon:yes gene_type:complete
LKKDFKERYMSRLEDKFIKFHAQNPHVWREFKRLAFDALEKGHRNYSAKLIIEMIRWESKIETEKVDSFKISNEITSFYPRMFHNSFPQLKGFFKTREVEEFDPEKHSPKQKELEL